VTERNFVKAILSNDKAYQVAAGKMVLSFSLRIFYLVYKISKTFIKYCIQIWWLHKKKCLKTGNYL